MVPVRRALSGLVCGSLLIAAPLAAQDAESDDGGSITFDRIQQVYLAAKTICPAAYTSDSAGRYVSDYADKNSYTPNEKRLLLTYCLTYGEGMVRGKGG